MGYFSARSVVLTAVTTTNILLWDVTQSSIVESSLKIEATIFSETLADLYSTTCFHIPSNPHSQFSFVRCNVLLE